MGLILRETNQSRMEAKEAKKQVLPFKILASKVKLSNRSKQLIFFSKYKHVMYAKNTKVKNLCIIMRALRMVADKLKK